MTRACIICGATFKYDRSANKHVVVVHGVPGDYIKLYLTKIDDTVPYEESDEDDIEIEIV